jgi:exodeoxyribonuclease V beta subunit
MTPGIRPFDVEEALPEGVQAIQASAGTGKTHTLVDLALRFIAEKNVPVAQILIVTFTRAATSELRSRLRERLVVAADFLAAEEPEKEDGPLEQLARTDRPARLERIRQAVSDFDAATITTIHGFATQMLGALGTTSGTDPDAALVDDAGDLAADACADTLAAAAADGAPSGELPTLSELVKATERALSCPDTTLVPVAGQTGARQSQLRLAQLVETARRTVAERRRLSGTLSYDDLLTELRKALEGSGGAATVETIRERFKVALIDEFQDTDPVQWDIFARLFAGSDAGTSLILVGDPKQAIFAFRGADVHTFLKAVEAPGTERRALERNWRSDGALIDSLDILFDGATFGEEAIAFERVEVVPQNADKRLHGADGRRVPALSLRLALGETLERTSRGAIQADGARYSIFADLVAQVRALLESATLPSKEADGPRPAVRPSDIAVLVRTGVEAGQVQRALIAQGIPAVLSRGLSVLQAPAADQWRLLLAALTRPSNVERARAFALSWFVGWSAEHLDAADDADLAVLQEQLQSWADTLTSHGVAPLVQRVMSDSGVVARVLGRPDGDRQVTDLEHIGELLQAATPSERPSLASLMSRLDVEPEIDAEVEAMGDVTARRIESEAQAVQIMTVWVAKGLQFPIVCVPTMWSKRAGDVMYQDPATGERTYDLAKGESWPTTTEARVRKGWAAEESLGEHLRLLYVALTRAKHHTIVWWTRAQDSERSSLAHLLFARDAQGQIDPDRYGLEKVDDFPADQDAEAFLQPLVDRAEGKIVVETIGRTWSPDDRWTPSAPAPAHPDLDLAQLDPLPDRTRKRWSFTAITREDEVANFDPSDSSLSDQAAGDESTGSDDGSAEPEGDQVGPMPGDPAVPAMAHLPAGPAFGTLVHSVLEGVDFTDQDLPAALRRIVSHQLARTPVDLTTISIGEPPEASGPALLVDALAGVIASPLGPGFGGRRLGDIQRRDRIDEMSFELHLGEGGRRPSVRDIGRLLVAHLPGNDPFAAWSDGLATAVSDLALAGHLTGSIDAVIRVPSDDGAPRFVVVDYKSNRLSEPGRPPGADDYGAARMVDAMTEHQYPLQALLYSVALHRYLRGRMGRDYDPARHLGGAAYLFVRGMTGPDVEQAEGRPHGVCHWDIPPTLVGALSDLLHGFSPAGAVR